MKSGTWIGGADGLANNRRPYASGYPENQELYLTATLTLDAQTGEMVTDETGNPMVHTGSILVRWEEIEYLEFTPTD